MSIHEDQMAQFLGEILLNSDLRSGFRAQPIETAETYGLKLGADSKKILKQIAGTLSDSADRIDTELVSAGLMPTRSGTAECICRSLNCSLLY